MSGSTTVSRRTQRAGSDVNDLLIQHNKLVDDLENLRRAVSYMQPGVCITDPAVKAGTTTPANWRSELFTLASRGKLFSVAAQEKALTAVTHNVAASKEAWFVLSVATDGSTFTITKGADQTIGTQVLPQTPDNDVVVGYMQIITGAGGAFTAATDPLTATVNIASIAFTSAPAVGAAALTGAKVGNHAGVAITT